MGDEVVEVLSRLVTCQSPNPPGDTRTVAGFVAEYMSDGDFRTSFYARKGNDESASIVAEAGVGRPCIIYHAHLDTVPVVSRMQWTTDPFSADIRDGRVYGLGACDDKGVLAAMMVAARGAKEYMKRGRILLVGASDEEAGGIYGTGFLRDSRVFHDADFAVVGEQTHNRVALCHKGTVRATIATYGRSVHATNPDRGINAIYAMADLVQAMQRYHRRLKLSQHPLLGSGTVSVNLINGGSAANVVAERCEATLDRRFVPPERAENVVEEILSVFREVEPIHHEVKAELVDVQISPWFEAPGTDPLTQQFMNTIRSVSGHDAGPVCYLPGSDAKYFMPMLDETPTVVFGPGSYEQAHAIDEWVSLEELIECKLILEEFAREALKNGAE